MTTTRATPHGRSAANASSALLAALARQAVRHGGLPDPGDRPDAADRLGLYRFPQGIPGYPGPRDFILQHALCEHEQPGLLLLRGLDGEAPWFFVLPASPKGGLEDRLVARAQGLSIASQSLLCLYLLIPTCRQGRWRLDINRHAPLLLDIRRRRGWQVPLHDDSPPPSEGP